jgi:hypothetical protein
MICGKDITNGLARPVTRFCLENDEAPWHELAMVGRARRDQQDCLQLASRRTPGIHQHGLHGAPCLQMIKHCSHGISGQAKDDPR